MSLPGTGSSCACCGQSATKYHVEAGTKWAAGRWLNIEAKDYCADCFEASGLQAEHGYCTDCERWFSTDDLKESTGLEGQFCPDCIIEINHELAAEELWGPRAPIGGGA